MFVVEDTFGYENNIFNKMKYIDQQAQRYATHYISTPYSDSGDETNSKSFSLYGKKIAKQVNNLNKIHTEIVNEIRDVSKRIKELAGSGKATKTEVDLRTGKYTLYKTLIDLNKTVADLEGKIEKGRMDDLKFLKDMELARAKMLAGGAAGNGGLNNVETNKFSTVDNYMNNLFGNGVDNFLVTNGAGNTPVLNTPTQPDPSMNQVQPQLVTNPVVTAPEEPKQNVTEVVEPPKSQDNIININSTNKNDNPSYIVNANGEYVDLGGEIGGFKEKGITDTELALNNIKIKQNPNMKEFFKYNKDYQMGWLTWIDTETKEENTLGTHDDLRLLYPIEIDTTNNLANTRLQNSYPIIYTDEVPSESVQEKYKMMRTIDANKQNKNKEEDEEEYSL